MVFPASRPQRHSHLPQVNPYVASAIQGWRADPAEGPEAFAPRGLLTAVPRVHCPAADLLRADAAVAGARWPFSGRDVGFVGH